MIAPEHGYTVHGMTSSEWLNVGRDRESNIKIPDSERLPLPPSTILQGQFGTSRDVVLSRKVPDLRGRTSEEVKREASCITMGEFFLVLIPSTSVLIHGQC